MGCTPRAYHNHALWAAVFHCTIYLFGLPEHNSIKFCSRVWLHLSPHLEPALEVIACPLPFKIDHFSAASCRNNFIACISLRLCLPGTHRLHNIHSRQILQAPTRDVLTSHDIPQAVPTVQVPRRRSCDGWGCNFLLPQYLIQEVFKVKLGLGSAALVHQPPVRWPHQ